MCDDLVWDPTFEELRVRKIGTGSFSANSEFPGAFQCSCPPLAACAKRPPSSERKHEELFAEPGKDDPGFIAANTTAASCRANGLRGIYNAGATCYQNVVLQSFLHNPMLRNFYLSDGHQSGSCGRCTLPELRHGRHVPRLLTRWRTRTVTRLPIFLSGFWISERKAFENLVTTKEQDAHEFFHFWPKSYTNETETGRSPRLAVSIAATASSIRRFMASCRPPPLVSTAMA